MRCMKIIGHDMLYEGYSVILNLSVITYHQSYFIAINQVSSPISKQSLLKQFLTNGN